MIPCISYGWILCWFDACACSCYESNNNALYARGGESGVEEDQFCRPKKFKDHERWFSKPLYWNTNRERANPNSIKE